MPPKKKITSELLIGAAMEIVREQGINAVTARTAAKAAGCSIQPVFADFGTMENFREQIYFYARDEFLEQMEEFSGKSEYYGKVCNAVLSLASEEPEVCRLLFSESVCAGRTVSALKESFLQNRKYLDGMITMYGLNEKSCIEIIGKGLVYVCGMAVILSSDSSYTTVQKGTAEAKMLLADLVVAAQRKRDNEKKRIVRKITDEGNMSD